MKDEGLPDFLEFGYQVIQELGQNRADGRVTYLASNTDILHSDVLV